MTLAQEQRMYDYSLHTSRHMYIFQNNNIANTRRARAARDLWKRQVVVNVRPRTLCFKIDSQRGQQQKYLKTSYRCAQIYVECAVAVCV